MLKAFVCIHIHMKGFTVSAEEQKSIYSELQAMTLLFPDLNTQPN